MEVPRHWRLKAQRYRLEGSICPICGQLAFPPRPICPHGSLQPSRVDARGCVAIAVSHRTADANMLKER